MTWVYGTPLCWSTTEGTVRGWRVGRRNCKAGLTVVDACTHVMHQWPDPGLMKASARTELG
jgi:hypothetical protein